MNLKFSKERQDAFVSAIATGCTYQVACGAARIVYMTYRDWMRKGEAELQELAKSGEEVEQLPQYAEFYLAVKAAEQEHAQRMLSFIETAAANPQTWQAAAWMLERRYVREYGRQITETVGKDDGPIQKRVTVVEIVKDKRDVDEDFNNAIADDPDRDDS